MSMSPAEQALLADLRARVAYLERNAEAPGIPDWNTLSGVPSVLRSDPNADRGVFWDDSAGALAFFTLGAPLSFSGTQIVVASATTAIVGASRFGTTAEVQADALTNVAVSPATLAARTATTSRAGIQPLASQSEVQAGTDPSKIVTSATLRGHRGVAFALSLQKISVASVAAGGNLDITVTFPSGRFSVAPGVILTSFGTRLNWQVTDGTVTATGCTIRVSNWTTGAQAATFVEVLAIQMTPTTGEG